MIYMVEMDFPHPERLPEWHAWYLAHIRVLLSVPGFRASQRFQAIHPTPAPYLALHEVSGPEMFESAAYRDRGGPASTGEWRELQTNWRRNLLDGVDETPDVPSDSQVLLLEGARDAPGCRIFIGSENRMFALSGSSVIAAPYRGSQGEVVGVVGVIGPTRLNYARVVPMVDFTAKALTRLMA